MILHLINSKEGSIFLSILFGLSLATLFKKSCKDNKCFLIKGPPITEMHNYVYKVDDDCYKYTPIVSDCDD